eukprot:EG_transcript_2499
MESDDAGEFGIECLTRDSTAANLQPNKEADAAQSTIAQPTRRSSPPSPASPVVTVDASALGRAGVPFLSARMLSFEDDLISVTSMDGGSFDAEAIARMTTDDQRLMEQFANACSGILIHEGRRRSTKHSVSFHPADLERPPSRILHIPHPSPAPPAAVDPPALSSPNANDCVPVHTVARIGPRTASSPSLKMRAPGRNSTSPMKQAGDTTPRQEAGDVARQEPRGQSGEAKAPQAAVALEEREAEARRALGVEERQRRDEQEDAFTRRASQLLRGMEATLEVEREAARARSRAAVLRRHVALVQEMRLLQCGVEEETARADISAEAILGVQKLVLAADYTLGPTKQRAKVVGEECRAREILLHRWRSSLEALCRLFSCQMEEQEWRNEIVIAMADTWAELTADCARVAAAAWLRLHDALVAVQGAEAQRRADVATAESEAWAALDGSPAAEAIREYHKQVDNMLEGVASLGNAAFPPPTTASDKELLPIWLQDAGSVPMARTLASYSGAPPPAPSASSTTEPPSLEGWHLTDKKKAGSHLALAPSWLYETPWGEPTETVVTTTPSIPPWLEGEPSSIGLLSMEPACSVASPSMRSPGPRGVAPNARDRRPHSASMVCNPAASFNHAFHMTHVAPPTLPPEGSNGTSHLSSPHGRKKAPPDGDEGSVGAASFSSRSSLLSLAPSRTTTPAYSPTSAPHPSAPRPASDPSDCLTLASSPHKRSPPSSAIGFQEAPCIIVKDVRTAFQLDMADGRIDGLFMGAEIVTQVQDGMNGIRNVRPKTASEYQALFQWEVERRLNSPKATPQKATPPGRSAGPLGRL